MPESPPILQGEWSEVLSRKDDIPAAQRVKVIPCEENESDEATEETQERTGLQAMLDRLFAEVDALELEPSADSPRSYGDAILEKYRKQGFKL